MYWQKILEEKVYKLSVLLQWMNSKDEWNKIIQSMNTNSMDLADQFSYLEGKAMKNINNSLALKAKVNYELEAKMCDLKSNRNVFSEFSPERDEDAVVFGPNHFAGKNTSQLDFYLNLIPSNTIEDNPFRRLDDYIQK